MNEAPKKILAYVDSKRFHFWDTDPDDCPDDSIPYIRADIVEELKEALEDMHRTQLNNNKHNPDYENTEQCLRVGAVLAKLEDI